MLTRRCNRNGNKNISAITFLSVHILRLLLQLVKKLKRAELSRGDYGGKRQLVFGHLQKVQATSPHGTCSGLLHFPLYYHRSLLQSWDEPSRPHTYRYIVAGIVMFPFAYILERYINIHLHANMTSAQILHENINDHVYVDMHNFCSFLAAEKQGQI